ncbi:MAG: tetratricopeptide repeat protein [Bacteroidia bacterium]
MKKNTGKEKNGTEKKVQETGLTEKKRNRRIILLLFLGCFLLYGKSIRNEFSMDDEFVIRNNKQVQKGLKAIPDIFRTTYVVDNQKASYEYRPVVKAVFALECQFFGPDPHAGHFFNILLYAFSLILLYFVLLRLLPGYHYILPLLVTLIFMVHPLHSEVVLSLKNRDVILSFMFCLLALRSYLQYADTSKIKYILPGTLFILLALMSKKDSMTYFAVIPFTVWFFKNVPWKKIGIIFLSYLIPILSLKALTAPIHQDIVRNFLQWENPLYINSTLVQRIPTGLYDLYFYVAKFIFPYPLISYYGYNQVPIASWSFPMVWIVLVLLCVTGWYVWKNIMQRKLEVYGIMYFLITISMFTNIVMPVVGIVGERFAYIPSLGLSLLAAWVLLKAFKIPFENKEFNFSGVRNSFWGVSGAILLIFSGMCFSRIADWKTTYSLYLADVQHATESAHANSLIAAASIQEIKEHPRMSMEEKRHHVEDAEKYYLESIRIIPDYVSSLNNLGMVYFTYYNEPDKAIPYLKKAIALDTDYVEAYFNLAICEAKKKNYDAAEKYFLKTIEFDKTFAGTYFSLSNVYAEEKKYDEILELNQKAMDQGLKFDILPINIGNVWYMRGDTAKAVYYLEQGIAINPNNKKLNSFLASYYKDKGDLEKANKYYDLMRASRP